MVSCLRRVLSKNSAATLPDLVIRNLLDVDMGPVEEVKPCVPIFLHPQCAPGPGQDGKRGQPLLAALQDKNGCTTEEGPLESRTPLLSKENQAAEIFFSSLALTKGWFHPASLSPALDIDAWESPWQFVKDTRG